MKRYKGVPWAKFIGFIGDTVKEELMKGDTAVESYDFTSTQHGYGRFGFLESNYTLREGNGIFGKLIGPKIFTIHDNSADGIIPAVTIHGRAYFGQKAYDIFNILRENLMMDIIVEYS